MIPRVSRLPIPKRAFPLSHTLLRRSVANEAHVRQPPHPEIDSSYKGFLREPNMSMGMGTGRSKFGLRHPSSKEVEELELIDASFSNNKWEEDTTFRSSDGDRRSELEDYEDERRSPATVLGSKRLGIAVLPEKMKIGIQNQVDQLEDSRDLRNEYLSLMAPSPGLSEAKSARQDKPYRTPIGELARAASIFPGEYGAVQNVMNEMKLRLGQEWSSGLLSGEILEISSSYGAGLWATLKSLGFLSGSRQEKEKLKYQFVHTSRHGLDLTKRILEGVPKDSIDIKFNRKRLTESPPSLILSTFHLDSFPSSTNRQAHLQELMSLSSPYIILIERSDPKGWESISQARSYLLSLSTEEEPLHIVAPCPHDGDCPILKMNTKDVCGFSQRLQRPPFLRKTKQQKKGEEEKGYCYLVVAKGKRPTLSTGAGALSDARISELRAAGRIGKVGRDAAEREYQKTHGQKVLQEIEGHEKILEVVNMHEPVPGVQTDRVVFEGDKSQLSDALKQEAYSWPRLIAPPMKRKGHVTMDTCCPDANIQRLTFSKSHSKQGYHDARKSTWGDLFPFTPNAKPVIRSRGVRRLGKLIKEDEGDDIIAELLDIDVDERSAREETKESRKKPFIKRKRAAKARSLDD